MTLTEGLPPALGDDHGLTLEQLCSVCAVTPSWVSLRIEEGLISVPEGEPSHWRFDLTTRLRVGRMRRLERDFDAVPELAALVADLQDEISALRDRLRRAGLD
jgi:chaperone modulatory protein CbpM